MSEEASAKERRILRLLRAALGNIIKDTAPQPGMPHPLKESTVESIRELFGLIAEREAELADQAGIQRNQRPHFADEPQDTSVVTLHMPGKNKLN
jgi:hypothetical protein